MSSGNPYHDSKTGEFASGPGGVGSHANGGAHSHKRSLGVKILHGAKVAAKVVALTGAALALGALAADRKQKKRTEEKSSESRRYVRNALDAMPVKPGLNESLRSAHIQTLRHPAVRVAHQHGLINPRGKK